MRVSRARLTPLLKPLQRDHGWAEEVWGAGLANTAAASLGFGSWEAGTRVKVEGWSRVVCVASWKGSRRSLCLCVCGRGAETRGMGMGVGMLLWFKAGSLVCVCLCVLFNLDRPSVPWCHIIMSGVCV